ncbi:MAG: FadR/GntR family transcriptional regulator [Candidatus Nanopelagicales bacterium]
MIHGPSGSEKARVTLDYLRSRIVSGEWPVNQRIPREPELMELIGVGKSTVREAVRSLASLGMLETIRGVGTFVRSRTPVSEVLTTYVADFPLEDVLVYRRALEIEAAQQAAVNRTEEQLASLRASLAHDREAESGRPVTIERGETPGPFHHLVFEAAGSPLLASLYAGVMAAIRRARESGRVVWGSSHDLRHLDHGRILRAIEEQDVVGAAHAMALHVDRDLVPDDAGLDAPRPGPRAEALRKLA